MKNLVSIIFVITAITCSFYMALSIDEYQPAIYTKADTLAAKRFTDFWKADSVINNTHVKFKCSGKLQDAGDFDRKLDTSIQRKVIALKLETDKYN